MRERYDVAVVGGGIIGLALAWRAAGEGLSAVVLERDLVGRSASHVAAGMLAPTAEAEYGPAGRRLLELGLRSAALWPAFAAELEAASGTAVGLRRSGTLLLARDADEGRELERQLDFRRSLGLEVRRLLPSAARALEPALAPTVRLALEAPGDHSVDPRLVTAALAVAARRAGVRIRERAPVAALALGGPGPRVEGVELADGTRVEAPQVVVAAGAWSEELSVPGGSVPVRPVKGQIVRLRDPAGPGLVERVLRYAGGYLVPRGDGRYLLGATMEERGFELAATAGGVYELLRDARELVPGTSELEIEELSVGLRPGTPDNAPAIGRGAVEGLVWACGHHRNGILLAPLTADAVASLLSGGGEGELVAEACAPARFAGAPLAVGAGR